MTQVVRRNNPYASSFDGSLSASLDKSQQIPYDPAYHMKVLASRPPLENMISEYRCDNNGGDFDVHSDCSDEAPEAHESATAYGVSPAPHSEQSPNGSSYCSYSGCSHFDAAEMNGFLASVNAPVDVPCAPGSIITVYNGDISQHFNIPSEHVQITRGSIKYADHQTRYGQQTRFRFQLCHNFLQRKCTRLSECSYIHATVLPKPSEVHLNPFAPRRLAADRHGRSNDVIPSHFDDPSIADGYPTLPAGFVITVHPPQGNQTSNELTSVPSDMIIKTVGGDLIFAAYKDNGGEEPSNLTPDQLPRHCTKFQYRRVCTSGTECPFIHSKVPFPGTWIGIATTVPTTTTAPIPPPSAPMQPPTTSVAPGLLPPGAVFAHPPTFVSAPPNLGYAPQQMFYMPTVPLDQTMGVPGPQTWPQPAPFVQPAPAAMVMAPPPPQHPYMFSQPPAGVQYFVMMPPQ